jgi:hypothetical protein
LRFSSDSLSASLKPLKLENISTGTTHVFRNRNMNSTILFDISDEVKLDGRVKSTSFYISRVNTKFVIVDTNAEMICSPL